MTTGDSERQRGKAQDSGRHHISACGKAKQQKERQSETASDSERQRVTARDSVRHRISACGKAKQQRERQSETARDYVVSRYTFVGGPACPGDLALGQGRHDQSLALSVHSRTRYVGTLSTALHVQARAPATDD